LSNLQTGFQLAEKMGKELGKCYLLQ